MNDRSTCNCIFHWISDISNIAQPSSHILFWNSEGSCPLAISTEFMMNLSTRNVILHYCIMICATKEYLNALNLKSSTLFLLFWAKYGSSSNIIDWFRIPWIFPTFDKNFLFWQTCDYVIIGIIMTQQFFIFSFFIFPLFFSLIGYHIMVSNCWTYNVLMA